MPPGSAKRRQPLLITIRSPLTERFGDAFFRALPAGPGVYFFRNVEGALLYIGQSGALRHRIGSYRHLDPDRHPRRLLRLIHRVASIEWRECGTVCEAIALEASLLLEHRPPFNRAGVWPSAEWWLEARVESETRLHLRMSRTPGAVEPDEACAAGEMRVIALAGEGLRAEEKPGELPSFPGAWHGPFSSRHRYTFPALARCLFLAMHPGCDPWTIPVGLMRNAGDFLACSWTLPPGGSAMLGEFLAFLSQPGDAFPASLKPALAASPGMTASQALREFWETQIEEITALVPTKPAES